MCCVHCWISEMHRVVLNQILRQSTTPLSDGPFSMLVDYTKVLDFDVKRRYFRQELERMDDGVRREDLAVHVRRDNIFEDSFRELHRRTPDEWKHRFYIVFEGWYCYMFFERYCCSYISKFAYIRNQNISLLLCIDERKVCLHSVHTKNSGKVKC